MLLLLAWSVDAAGSMREPEFAGGARAAAGGSVHFVASSSDAGVRRARTAFAVARPRDWRRAPALRLVESARAPSRTQDASVRAAPRPALRVVASNADGGRGAGGAGGGRGAELSPAELLAQMRRQEQSVGWAERLAQRLAPKSSADDFKLNWVGNIDRHQRELFWKLITLLCERIDPYLTWMRLAHDLIQGARAQCLAFAAFLAHTLLPAVRGAAVACARQVLVLARELAVLARLLVLRAGARLGKGALALVGVGVALPPPEPEPTAPPRPSTGRVERRSQPAYTSSRVHLTAADGAASAADQAVRLFPDEGPGTAATAARARTPLAGAAGALGGLGGAARAAASATARGVGEEPRGSAGGMGRWQRGWTRWVHAIRSVDVVI